MPAPDPWTDLGHGLRVRRSRAYAMNSVLLLDSEHTVVVDPGVLPSEIDDLARVTRGASPAKVTLAFTHAHWDHVLGRPWWPAAQTLGHDRLAMELKRDAAMIAGEARAIATQHGETWERGFAAFEPDLAASGLHFMKLGPWRLVLRDAPGHCDSQMTFHLPDHGALIAADMLSDIEPPMLNGPPVRYFETLCGLQPLVEGGAIETLIPGHGSIAVGAAAVAERLERDLDYLERLEDEVARARAEGLDLEATRARLAGMGYPGRERGDANLPEHLENVGFAFEASAPGRGRGSKSRG